MLAFVCSALPVLYWIISFDPSLQELQSRIALLTYVVAPVALVKLDLDGLAESGMLFDLQSFLSFRGRAGREEFWATLTFVLALDIFLTSLLVLLLGPFMRSPFGICLLALLFGGLALWSVAVRRLHDCNRSGRWLALVGLVALAGLLPHAPAVAALLLAGLVVVVCLGSLPGTEGENVYGIDPDEAYRRQFFWLDTTPLEPVADEGDDVPVRVLRPDEVYSQRVMPKAAAAASVPDARQTLGAYMTKLSEMRAQGEISEEEYTAQVNVLMAGTDVAPAPADAWLPLEERVQRNVGRSRTTRYLMVGVMLLSVAAIAGLLFFLRWYNRVME